MSPTRKREALDHVKDWFDASERRVCRVIGQHQSPQQSIPSPRFDQLSITKAIIDLAKNYRRYGYRQVPVLLNRED